MWSFASLVANWAVRVCLTSSSRSQLHMQLVEFASRRGCVCSDCCEHLALADVPATHQLAGPSDSFAAGERRHFPAGKYQTPSLCCPKENGVCETAESVPTTPDAYPSIDVHQVNASCSHCRVTSLLALLSLQHLQRGRHQSVETHRLEGNADIN